jgi:hypothetical protein
MTPLRSLLLPPLIAILVLTGVGIGMARGAMAAEGQLCSVTGPVPLVLAPDGLPLFDDDGAPVLLDRAACLDCLTVAADLPPHASPLLAPTAAAGLAAWGAGDACRSGRIPGLHRARGPPRPV